MSTPPRRSPRVACALPVHWRRYRTQLTGEVRCCNVHGMFIATDHDVPLGYLIDLTIELPTGPISATAIPRYVGDKPDGHGIGVELHVMDSSDRELWSSFYRQACGLDQTARRSARR